MLSSLDSDYLGRVKRTYRLAVSECTPAGPVWAPIDARRADIHAAMLAETDNDLRNIFSDPLSTDLYYGVDDLCRTIRGEHLGNEEMRKSLSKDMRVSFSRMAAVLGADDDCDAILATLDNTLRQKVDFPAPFRGEWGLLTSEARSAIGHFKPSIRHAECWPLSGRVISPSSRSGRVWGGLPTTRTAPD